MKGFDHQCVGPTVDFHLFEPAKAGQAISKHLVTRFESKSSVCLYFNFLKGKLWVLIINKQSYYVTCFY